MSTTFSQEFRISVAGLERGMFVSRLDRPWIGTGFPLEGVKLASDDEIRRLQGMCHHVFVDVVRGRSPGLRYIVLDDERRRDGDGRAEVAALRRARWEPTREFAAETVDARRAHEHLKSGVRELMQNVQRGSPLDVEKLAQGVDAMLDSITRNPSALPWVMEMRRKGEYVYQHGLGSAIWAATFGRHLGLERDDLRDLALGALLCDVGKVRLSTDLLLRRGPLAERDLIELRRHLVESCRIVDATPGLSPVVRQVVAHHHERHDGSGYPQGLRGSAIPMFARIAGLVDSYDAMTSVRPYAPVRSPHQAVMELYDSRDRLFQAELVEQFIRTCGIYPTGSLVELSDGSVGVVMSINSLKRLRPSIMLLLGADKRPLPEFRPLDLGEILVDAQGHPLSIRSSLPPGAYGIDRASLFLD